MKGSKRFLLLFISILLVLSISIGCSSKQPDSQQDMVTIEEFENSSQDMEAAPEESNTLDLEGEKVITTVSLSFQTTDFDSMQDKLNKVITKHKSYVENSNISYNQYYKGKNYRYADFTIRVPKGSVSDFKDDLAAIGHLISENTNKEDVTKHYKDTQSRLNVLTTKEERILALLEKAEKIEDIIALENQLSETISEKEILKSSLLSIDDHVDYSTIYLQVEEVDKLMDAKNRETSFTTRIKNAFTNSLYRFKVSLENFLIAAIYALPFIVIFAIFIIAALKVYGKISNKKDKSN